ncbi:DUF3592 domain-containing protein [Streptomyces sp. NPDC048290]|uniref:DUF3592 domain-containing protein n=1 Tax=Streptomyces sp. NPDC048290 TaxID=3155811 RepID=UPI003425C853
MVIAIGVFGLLFSAIGVVIFRNAVELRKNAVESTATVTERIFKLEAGARPVGVIVKFDARDGRTREASVGVPSGRDGIQVGDTLKIIYNSTNLADVWNAESVDLRKRRPVNGFMVWGALLLVIEVVLLATVGWI